VSGVSGTVASKADEVRITGFLRRTAFFEGDVASPIRELIFHVPNFVDFFGGPIAHPAPRGWSAARATFRSSPWLIHLDGVADGRELTNELRRAGGYALTHVGVIQRE